MREYLQKKYQHVKDLLMFNWVQNLGNWSDLT